MTNCFSNLFSLLFTTITNYNLLNCVSSIFDFFETGNFNTPEVIWKYSMRTHLVKMIDQHVGNVHARLVQNTATRFDLEFGPIPDVRYTELDNELWCENYYLGKVKNKSFFFYFVLLY